MNALRADDDGAGGGTGDPIEGMAITSTDQLDAMWDRFYPEG